MNGNDWKSLILLKPRDVLRSEGVRVGGFLAEEDIESYSIIDENGKFTGSITVRDHTAVKGFRRTIGIIQRDEFGKVVLDKTYTVL